MLFDWVKPQPIKPLHSSASFKKKIYINVFSVKRKWKILWNIHLISILQQISILYLFLVVVVVVVLFVDM